MRSFIIRTYFYFSILTTMTTYHFSTHAHNLPWSKLLLTSITSWATMPSPWTGVLTQSPSLLHFNTRRTCPLLLSRVRVPPPLICMVPSMFSPMGSYNCYITPTFGQWLGLVPLFGLQGLSLFRIGPCHISCACLSHTIFLLPL